MFPNSAGAVPALSNGRVIETDVVHDGFTLAFDAAVVRS